MSGDHNMHKRICTMNCGPALGDTRTQEQRMADCEDCVEAAPVKGWVELHGEAQRIVESSPLWKRFIDGTPLSNDIACWMVDFALANRSKT